MAIETKGRRIKDKYNEENEEKGEVKKKTRSETDNERTCSREKERANTVEEISHTGSRLVQPVKD